MPRLISLVGLFSAEGPEGPPKDEIIRHARSSFEGPAEDKSIGGRVACQLSSRASAECPQVPAESLLS